LSRISFRLLERGFLSLGVGNKCFLEDCLSERWQYLTTELFCAIGQWCRESLREDDCVYHVHDCRKFADFVAAIRSLQNFSMKSWNYKRYYENLLKKIWTSFNFLRNLSFYPYSEFQFTLWKLNIVWIISMHSSINSFNKFQLCFGRWIKLEKIFNSFFSQLNFNKKLNWSWHFWDLRDLQIDICYIYILFASLK
jgi:hypothetical protein